MRDKQKTIDGLHELIRALETNSDLNPYLGTIVQRVDSKEEMRSIIKAVGGKWTKRADDSDFEMVREFGNAFSLMIYASHEQICKRVVTGTKMVPEAVVEATEAKVIPAHEVEIVEWVCPDSLMDEGAPSLEEAAQ